MTLNRLQGKRRGVSVPSMCKPSSMSPCHFNPNPLVRRLELYAAFWVQRPILPRAVSFPRKLEWTRSVSKGKRLAVSVTQNSTWKLILHKTLELSRKGFRNHLVQLLHVTGNMQTSDKLGHSFIAFPHNCFIERGTRKTMEPCRYKAAPCRILIIYILPANRALIRFLRIGLSLKSSLDCAFASIAFLDLML
ncbi:hypothetical protein MJG53_010042 [Ovis ammon polii x Ovis aries]|uniref:Uncharacterized protein n=1 Tax=Ovis ammon polii x Ovis aries TaxID=2918886 RepID=A0ACB9UV99_9CETA|nr:hypothetical protein MJG53_010042 [Ovis ammon polii x Ovis aries]